MNPLRIINGDGNKKPGLTRLNFGVEILHTGETQDADGIKHDQYCLVLMLKRHGERDRNDTAVVIVKRNFVKDCPEQMVAEVLMIEAMRNPSCWQKLLRLTGAEVKRSCDLEPTYVSDKIAEFANG